MKNLILLRHGKSHKRTFKTPDKERPLVGRGKADIQRTIEKLKKIMDKNYMIISSDSQRTIDTTNEILKLMPPKMTPKVPPIFLSSLYNCEINEFRDELRVHGVDDINTVIAVGHDPIWSKIASSACGIDITLKTSDAAMLNQEVDSWSDVDFHGERELEGLVR